MLVGLLDKLGPVLVNELIEQGLLGAMSRMAAWLRMARMRVRRLALDRLCHAELHSEGRARAIPM